MQRRETRQVSKVARSSSVCRLAMHDYLVTYEKIIGYFQLYLTQIAAAKESRFLGLISRCFESHLHVYIESQDK